MPKNKELKRLTGAHVNKTGESNTAARAQLLARKVSPGRGRSHVELAGMSDEAVKTKTGKTWKQWVAALDAAGAADMSHRDIAKHVRASYEALARAPRRARRAAALTRALCPVGRGPRPGPRPGPA